MIPKDRKFYVYKHTNKINGKVYIGITCQKPEDRWCNGAGYSNQLFFRRAIKKYGWDNFEHEILYEGLDNEDAVKIEAELIQYYKSLGRCYNVSNGFDDTPDRSIEVDLYKVDGSFIGSFKSIEQASKVTGISSSGLCMSLNRYKGRTHYKEVIVVRRGETPDIISAQKALNRARKVVQISKDGNIINIFGGIYKAHKATGVCVGSLYNCLHGKHKYAGGYKWEYLDKLKF